MQHPWVEVLWNVAGRLRDEVGGDEAYDMADELEEIAGWIRALPEPNRPPEPNREYGPAEGDPDAEDDYDAVRRCLRGF